VLATWLIRPDLSGKRGLSYCFTLRIFREHNEKISLLAARARQTLDKTRDFSLNRRNTFRLDDNVQREVKVGARVSVIKHKLCLYLNFLGN
jgi:hypothetical protein